MDDEELKRRIEARARELWEADGRPKGRDMGTSTLENTTDSPPGKLGATSPIVLAAAVALVVVAAIGWWHAIDRSSAVAALETVKVGLDKEVAELKGQLAGTGQKLADTGQKLVETEKANGDLAKVESKLAEAMGTLNQRLAILGEREQVEIDRALQALRDNKAASEAELAQIQSRIGERLKILGEREQALADYENKVRLAAYRVDQLQAEAATVEPRLAAMKGQLEQIDIQVAARQRAIDESFGRVAKAKAALEEIRQLVSQ
jgi:chromosome segregation ATPase